MNTENRESGKNETLWCIDLDWYKSNNRSISTLAKDRLCSKCRKRLKVDKSEVGITELITAINECCSNAPEYISKDLPILESVFRLFLANGNQPLEIEILNDKLNELRGRDSYRTSVELLSRLLKADRYYGLKQVNV
jgi:hypothetical protein